MARRVSETLYFVRDLDRAIQFYTQKVGYTLQHRYDWGFAIVSVDGHGNLGLMLETEWEREYPDDDSLPRPRMAIQTDQFEEDLHHLRQMGVPTSSVQGKPGGRRAVSFFDPEENAVLLWSDPEDSMES
jgi:catechol 2,3-dioxygenase-like lactoylglutathione lyase family enzyme